jgi:aspartokinase-like uncharacterized kinase
VIKVGGSLAQRPRALRRLMTTLARLGRRHHLVVVAGGGRFADEVRHADRRFDLANTTAHWMAILAMDQFAHLLRDLAPGTVLAHAARELRPGRLNVLAPSAWLQRLDPLPHSWDVTSDSIAAWIASALRARRLILLKSVDGVATGRAPARSRRTVARHVPARRLRHLVDPYFARALAIDMPCWVLSGRHPGRVAALLRPGSTRATAVISEGAARPPRTRSRRASRQARPRARD